MKRISDLAINANGFAFDPNFGEGFLLNETAIELLSSFNSGCDMETAAARLAEKYSISKSEALSDAFDLMAKLRILGFEVN